MFSGIDSVCVPRAQVSVRSGGRSGKASQPSTPALIAWAQRSFGICKPWGDSERYDFILDNRPKPNVHLFRVQVKCTDSLRAGAYETRATYTTGKGRAVYTKRDIDFIAAHVVELDIWYIIPVEVCTPAPMLRFYPHRKAKRMRLEQYREAWHLLAKIHRSLAERIKHK